MIDISIIIPVYNVEQYLNRCLDSIFKQQFDGTFEIIAVDDCSTDNSLSILYDYQRKENRLKIICHEENKKLSIARATGMSNATGCYIMHVDSDDWILPDTLQKLYSKIQETNSDIVVFDYYRENCNGEKYYVNRIKKEKIFTEDKRKIQSLFYGNSVTKIVRRELTENLVSSEISINTTEDLLYCFEIFLKAKKICVIPDYYYVYFWNNQSITHTIPIASEQYLKNQTIILCQIQKITNKYPTEYLLTNNVLDFIEKKMLFHLFDKHKYKKRTNNSININFKQFSNLLGNRLNCLNKAEKNYFICFKELSMRSNIVEFIHLLASLIRFKISHI
jgi:glycosyltransferase involved in cell wall biosynthesis